MKIKIAVLVVCLLLVSGIVGWTFSRGTLFKLSEIQVISDNPAIQARVRDHTVYLLGRNLVLLPLREIESQVRQIPRTRDIVLKKRWPNTLVIHVKTESVVAMVFKETSLWGLDSKCRVVELLSSDENVPLLETGGNFKGQNSRWPPSYICEGLLSLKKQKRQGPLLYSDIDEINWESEKGLQVINHKLNLEIDLGSDDVLGAWDRAAMAYAFLIKSSMHPRHLDSGYSRRVVFSPVTKLQFSKNELNLKGLVHRTDGREVNVR